MIEDKQPFSILIYSIERDLELTPDGFGGEIHFKPSTPMHGGTGMNGDYLLREWREVTDALAAEKRNHEITKDQLDKAWTKIHFAPHQLDCSQVTHSGKCDCWKSEF